MSFRPARERRLVALSLLPLLLLAGLAAPGSVPTRIHYQGLLLDDLGAPVNGAVALDLALFPTLVGGTALWSESHAGVPVTDGLYEVELGSVTPLTPGLLAGGTAFLEITVDAELLTPRQQLLAVPYALRAAEAESAESAAAVSSLAGSVSAETLQQLFELADSDGTGPPNGDPIEGSADVDGDGIQNFFDPDNDGDGLDDGFEIGQGSDPNLVTPSISGFVPPTSDGFTPSVVTVNGDGFLPGLSVVFGTETPTPLSLTTTSFDVSLGPQPEGSAGVVLTNTNGESVSDSYPFFFVVPAISGYTPGSVAANSGPFTVTVNGANFEPGITVAFGSENPTPTSVTSTSFDVDVGPQAPGTVLVSVTHPNGKVGQDNTFEFTGGRLAFVTSTLHAGDFGGLAGADAICAARASAASLFGSYLAWTAQGATGPATRFTTGEDYERVDGQPVASSFADLTDGSIQNPIQVDEFGASVGATDPVWTGVNTLGSPAPPRCSEWTDGTAGQSGRLGVAGDTGTTWTAGGTQTCDQTARLYCFQQ